MNVSSACVSGEGGRGVRAACGRSYGLKRLCHTDDLHDTGRLECLEARTLLTAFHWSAEEVYMLELVNRARSNPSAEGARYGIDLTAGLTSGELARLVASEPLAMNAELTLAARAHAQDMATRLFFDHVNPDGDDPTDRAVAHGYSGTAGENIAAGYTDIDDAHIAWMQSLGHRKNVFSLHTSFTTNFHYDEFGYGYAYTSSGQYHRYFAQSFGYQGVQKDLFALGVVYRDSNNNDFYTIGEGASDILVEVHMPDDPTLVVGSYTTDSTGIYQIVLNAGSYIIRFTDTVTGKIATQPLTIGSTNVKVDTDPATFVDPDDPSLNTDDHANLGAFANATVVSLNTAGDGAASGRLSPATDTDLFTFTPGASGQYTITVRTPSSSLNPRAGLYNSGGTSIAQGAVSGVALDEWRIQYNVVGGQTYFICVESADAASTGLYSLLVEAPVDDPGGGDPDDPPPFAADPTGATQITSNSAGRLTAVTINQDGRPIVFQQNSTGGWSPIDLLDAAGGATVVGRLVAYTDPKDGLTYVAAPSVDGLLLYRQDALGQWTLRNLTAEIEGSIGIVTSLTSFVSLGNVVHLAGVDAGGEVVLYRQGFNQGANLPVYAWNFIDLAEDLRSQGMTVPAFSGPLISYVTRWNGLNIAGLDATGDIHAVWWAPGLQKYRTSNLSDTTGAPAISGGLTVYLTRWGGINLAGADSDGKVSVTWWVPGFGGQWRTNNLTNESGGPTLNAESVSSYVTRWGGLNIVGTRSDGEIVVYWWVPGFRSWRNSAISTGVDDDILPDGAITGHATGGGALNLVGIAPDGDVVRYHWRPQTDNLWHFENITEAAISLL